MSLLAPYAAAIKAICGVALAGVVFYGGCKAQKSVDAEAMSEVQDMYSEAYAQAQASKLALEEVNEIARLEKARADEWMRAGKEAATRAEAEAARYREGLAGIDKAIEDAKRDPGCRAKLEEQVCAQLH